MRPRKRTRSDEESQSVSANRNFRARKVFRENSPHSSQRRSATSNVRRPTSNKIRTMTPSDLDRPRANCHRKSSERQKSKTILPGGRIELPTNPECFRGCSDAVNGRLRSWDSSFALMSAQFLELLQELELPSWRRFRANRRVA